jgi:hypothetical protein
VERPRASLNQPQGIEKLVLVDSYGLGGEVPSGRLGYLSVRSPFVSELTRALLRRSRRMGRWSLFNAVHHRRVVTEEMEEARGHFA